MSASSAALLPAQDAPTALLDSAAHAYAAFRSVRAPFEQTLTNATTGSVEVARGEFFQRGPSRFAFRFSEPAGDAIVCDGNTVWVYLPSTAKGQVLKMTVESGPDLDLFTQLLTAPREHYKVAVRRDTTIGAHAAASFVLTPRQEGAPFLRATLRIGRDDALLWQLEMVEPTGLVRRLTFSSIQPNAELPPGAVTFAVPEGVRVIDQESLFGKKP